MGHSAGVMVQTMFSCLNATAYIDTSHKEMHLLMTVDSGQCTLLLRYCAIVCISGLFKGKSGLLQHHVQPPDPHLWMRQH